MNKQTTLTAALQGLDGKSFLLKSRWVNGLEQFDLYQTVEILNVAKNTLIASTDTKMLAAQLGGGE